MEKVVRPAYSRLESQLHTELNLFLTQKYTTLLTRYSHLFSPPHLTRYSHLFSLPHQDNALLPISENFRLLYPFFQQLVQDSRRVQEGEVRQKR